MDYFKNRYENEVFGYWCFQVVSAPEAIEVIQAHIDSLASIAFNLRGPTIWKTHYAPTDVLRKNLHEGFLMPLDCLQLTCPRKTRNALWRHSSAEAPTCWCKLTSNQLSAKDNQQMPPECPFSPANAPIYFGTAKYDYACVPKAGYTVFGNEVFSGYSVTILADEIARNLEAWIEGAVMPKAGLQQCFLYRVPSVADADNACATFSQPSVLLFYGPSTYKF
ncbi:uncharacterized protein PHACADRAFT_194945 [Phanerochaete carnosa HHB-10118-sp]|uniref:Uncharacterized protein n=1 Tax=Phanerochaete carnosa (strain HHB-10118-sp) TaxID=650164 RepID=K5X3M3_PHACS|nr:uncharacterized protein PHACADRAFT_194945 [Phanerochaete carnosa HHB-10118-sp]EKM57397.1 hypothetical protein PHACADRAFT_194945 [Phanerochaete carnosa HHB-10118-sp]